MILIVDICKERLHYLEFVKPIEDILKGADKKYFVRSYLDISDADLDLASCVIICGTSLKDFDYLNHLENFGWLTDFEKPVLGICGGMQILISVFKGIKNLDENVFIERKKIGFSSVLFEKEFLGALGKREVYELHNLGVRRVGRSFFVFAKNDFGIQAIKHREKNIYGALFHPEVRNKEIILEFVKNEYK